MTSVQVIKHNDKANTIHLNNEKVSRTLVAISVFFLSPQVCWYICVDLLRYPERVDIGRLGIVFYHVFVNLNNGMTLTR